MAAFIFADAHFCQGKSAELGTVIVDLPAPDARRCDPMIASIERTKSAKLYLTTLGIYAIFQLVSSAARSTSDPRKQNAKARD
jgi:hypothetical protein